MRFVMLRKDFSISMKRARDMIEDVPQDDLNVEHFIFPNGIKTSWHASKHFSFVKIEKY